MHTHESLQLQHAVITWAYRGARVVRFVRSRGRCDSAALQIAAVEILGTDSCCGGTQVCPHAAERSAALARHSGPLGL